MIKDFILHPHFVGKFSVEPTGCWIWKRGRSDSGYGISWYDGRTIGAHRLSYILHIGDVDQGLSVLHTCDNPLCINPNHLFVGSPRDNSKDMVLKNRQARGERCGNAKLTQRQVDEIRTSKESSRKIASQYNISKTNVLDIKRNYIWKTYAN